MTTAFVLSGGGSLGSVQAGMLLALAKHGVTPDLLVGTSVGAINAAWPAGHPGVDGAQQTDRDMAFRKALRHLPDAACARASRIRR